MLFRSNPDQPMEAFPFSTKKMSGSGALFDIDKLKDVSKNVISRMGADEVYGQAADWAAANDPELHGLLTRDPDYTKAILAIGRGGKKPRKDIALWTDVKPYLDFMFDELFQPDYTLPANVPAEDAKAILSAFEEQFNESDTPDDFFEKMKALAETHGYAPETKLYKKNPEQYKGHVGDISMVIRVAVAGRQNAPDLQSVMKILGAERVKSRLRRAAESL